MLQSRGDPAGLKPAKGQSANAFLMHPHVDIGGSWLADPNLPAKLGYQVDHRKDILARRAQINVF